jgi:hypothetical protein
VEQCWRENSIIVAFSFGADVFADTDLYTSLDRGIRYFAFAYSIKKSYRKIV